MTAETISTGIRTRTRVALLLAAATTALAGCGNQTDPTAEDPAGGEQPGAASSSAPTEAAEDTGTATASPSSSAPAATVTVPVYWAGRTPQGPRLFREFHRVAGDDALGAAADLLTSGKPHDPDYRTLYPGGTFQDVTFDGSSIVVTVPDDGWSAPVGQTRAEARLAVQQLVYTLQGVQQQRVPVRVVAADGRPVPLFGQQAPAGFQAAPQLDVLAMMNVTTPAEGQEVADTFTAEGVGSSFEATVIWQVRDSSGARVLDGFTTAEGWMDKLYPWRAEVDVSSLAAGTYTFVASTDDPSGGAEGAGPTEDTRTIVVR